MAQNFSREQIRRALSVIVNKRVNAQLAEMKKSGRIRNCAGSSDELARLETIVERLVYAVETLAAERPKREIQIVRQGDGKMVVREI